MPVIRKKLLLSAALALAGVVATVIIADYFGLFGVSERTSTDFVEFRVRTLDSETGRAISNVNIRCFQYGSNNACAQPPSRERGVVRVHLLVEKHLRRSLFFEHGVRYSPVSENELRIMYIHTEYDKPVQRYDVSALLAEPNRTFSVEMKPLMTAAEAQDVRDRREEVTE